MCVCLEAKVIDPEAPVRVCAYLCQQLGSEAGEVDGDAVGVAPAVLEARQPHHRYLTPGRGEGRHSSSEGHVSVEKYLLPLTSSSVHVGIYRPCPSPSQLPGALRTFWQMMLMASARPASARILRTFSCSTAAVRGDEQQHVRK